MRTIAGAVGVLMLGLLSFSQAACAQPKPHIPTFATTLEAPAAGILQVQSKGQFPISAAEAGDIARGSVPGSQVLKVQLLPSGVYAVTLKDGDNVSRVMVDATTGAIS